MARKKPTSKAAKLKPDKEAIVMMLETMRDAGCPEDQAESFISRGYVPIPGFLPFHADARRADNDDGPEWIALGGKRGPGKSHSVMAQIMDDMTRQEELKILFLRKIQKSARESVADLIGRVFRFTPHSPTDEGLRLPNGSKLVIGGFKDSKDVEKYLGIEYDAIAVEECTQITELKKDQLRGSLRTSKQSWRPRMYLSTNADGIGLSWFKKQFVEPKRLNAEDNTRFHDVTHIHNPYVNKDYEKWLNSLTGNLAKAWREGDWDAFAGMAFQSWNREQHVTDPFSIPSHWVKWRATDWGSASPYCTLWLAKDPDTRRVYVYREHYAAHLTDKQQARAIVDMTPPGETIAIHYADPALWEKKSRGDVVFSTYDEYKSEGVILTKGNNDRIGGKRRVDRALADIDDGLPGLQIFETCPHLIDQLSTLASDESNPEDVDTDQEDHAYDTLRYGLTNEKRLDPPPPPKVTHHPMADLRGI